MLCTHDCNDIILVWRRLFFFTKTYFLLSFQQSQNVWRTYGPWQTSVGPDDLYWEVETLCLGHGLSYCHCAEIAPGRGQDLVTTIQVCRTTLLKRKCRHFAKFSSLAALEVVILTTSGASIDENVAKWYFVFSKTNDICRNANFVVTGPWRQSWHHDDSNVSIWWRHHDCYDVFREGKEPPGTTLEDVKYARKLYESSYHPDSGELGNVIGRMSFQVPGGMIITAGMLQFYRYGVRMLHIFGIVRYNVTRGSQRLNKPMHQTTVQGRNMRLMASQIPGNLINSIFSK